ncbi:ATP-dependent DNA ligase [Streptomyces sp. NPDC059835]|uniref:ATP-dependent DNA ligase n=1 Tax=Streptomyces sp. NPDC059835 TaxID=3346967 RepID=UPI00364A19A8
MERETWTTDEFGTSHEGAVGFVLDDGTGPGPVYFDSAAGSGGSSASQWYVHDRRHPGRPRAAVLRAVTATSPVAGVRLEKLFTDYALTAPWALVPMTKDLAKAREWLETWTDASWVEEVLIKGMATRYLPGFRGRTKIGRRDTTKAVIGAVTSTLARPQLLVLGRHEATGRLRAVGRTVPLRRDQARQVAEHLTAADPSHPWTGVRFAVSWESRDVLDAILVRPELVAEVSADRAVDRGRIFRHPLRFKRLRLDVVSEGVPRFGAGSVAG